MSDWTTDNWSGQHYILDSVVPLLQVGGATAVIYSHQNIWTKQYLTDQAQIMFALNWFEHSNN